MRNGNYGKTKAKASKKAPPPGLGFIKPNLTKAEVTKAAAKTKEARTFDSFWAEVLVYYSTKVGQVSIKGPSHHDRDRMGYFAAKSSSIEFVREGDLEKLYFHLEESKKMSQIYRKPCTRWAELVVSAR